MPGWAGYGVACIISAPVIGIVAHCTLEFLRFRYSFASFRAAVKERSIFSTTLSPYRNAILALDRAGRRRGRFTSAIRVQMAKE